jgi:hypothetical protein
MTITYLLKSDPAYYRTVMARYYQQKSFFGRLPVQFSILAMPYVAAMIYAWITNASWKYLATYAGTAMIVLCIAAIYLTKALIQRRLLRGKDAGVETTLTIAEEGLTFSNSHGNGTFNWSVYPRSVRFPDGILLLRQGAIRWLPDSALQDAASRWR